jgi:hypothetical protein
MIPLADVSLSKRRLSQSLRLHSSKAFQGLAHLKRLENSRLDPSRSDSVAVDGCLARASVIQHNAPDRTDFVLRYAFQVRGAFLKLF